MWNPSLYSLQILFQVYVVSGAKSDRPRSRCEKWRTESIKVPGSYIPRCQSDGTFELTQCHYTTKNVRCWHVDKHGNVKGDKKTPYIFESAPTRSTSQQQYLSTSSLQPFTNDASYKPFRYTNTDTSTKSEIVETYTETKTLQPMKTRPLTKCEKIRKRRLWQSSTRQKQAKFVPTCTKDGHFQREQCNIDNTKCWCVGRMGKRIRGTKVGHQFPNCYPDICGKRFQNRPSRTRRVVGGRESVPNTWPWQALVLFSDPKHFCGGTLVKKNWLVTAASCFDNFPKRNSEWNVKLGAHKLNTSNADKLSVEAIHIHPQYKPGNNSHPGDYDIALVQVSSSARIPQSIMPLCLPENINFYKPGARCTITGWGHTSYKGSLSPRLREAWVDLVPLSECNSEKSYNGSINDRFMCAGYKEGGMDACHFDTGGPLACPVKGGLWTLAGIVSWRQTCAEPYKYGVYTNVYQVKPWIDKIIKR